MNLFWYYRILKWKLSLHIIYISSMFNDSEAKRINYANTKHHREIVRDQLREKLEPTINQIEISANPDQGYRNAFKRAYLDELERTVEEHKERKMQKQAYHEIDHHPNKNGASLYQHHNSSALFNPSPQQNSHAMSRVKTFHDYEEEKASKYNTMVEKQLQNGSSFFKEQDSYMEKKRREMQATNAMLQEQLRMKEVQKFMRQEEKMKENYQVMDNRRKQEEVESMLKERSREAQMGLRQDILNQMEQEREKRHRKSINNPGLKVRHNPITNPISYHIDNPYILGMFHRGENPQY